MNGVGIIECQHNEWHHSPKGTPSRKSYFNFIMLPGLMLRWHTLCRSLFLFCLGYAFFFSWPDEVLHWYSLKRDGLTGNYSEQKMKHKNEKTTKRYWKKKVFFSQQKDTELPRRYYGALKDVAYSSNENNGKIHFLRIFL